MRLAFDIETNGLYDTTDRVHVISIEDLDTGQVYHYDREECWIGAMMLQDADFITGHNIIGFDIPVLKKIYPWFNPKGEIFDTFNAAMLIWADENKHSLRAWGERLKEWKGEYAGPWDEWNEAMSKYCRQDVVVTVKLFQRIAAQDYPMTALALEHDVARIISRQVLHGFAFDYQGAKDLLKCLVYERYDTLKKLRKVFPDWWENNGEFNPKVNNKKLGYTAGCPMTRIELLRFTPTKKYHVVKKLKELGWKPEIMTENGEPVVDEPVLIDLARTIPIAQTIQDFLTIEKRIGQIARGKEAWLNHGKNGVIHGSIKVNGAISGRMTHFNPNMSQVPAVYSPFGRECRSLFRARPGRVLVGIDASGLELRGLANLIAYYDGGEYAKKVISEDIHTYHQQMGGLPTRDMAKTFIYALIYGAGNAKLGKITKTDPKKGGELKEQFIAAIPGLREVTNAVQAACRRGWLKGLDGRRLIVRSPHSALNSKIQSDGGLIMKKALVYHDAWLQNAGLVPGVDYEYVANSHDEWQIECVPEHAKEIGLLGIEAIKEAGRTFEFRCPLDGEYKIGQTWADTH